MAAELKVDEAKVKAVYGKISEAEIRTIFKGMVVESAPVDPKIDKFRKTTITESKPAPAATAPEARPRAVRIMEGFSRPVNK